ncbi:hypothetical protein [Paucibacter sp. XJ19-41]|uniref:hypothetical protein n=1 Tax=Paucibacter sp. XJ19-41 TaxID=2927824 RepID=UPI00234910C8|nr:hypothetical protein [Paucibacter sp. XJ19-41]MDC6166270.1 hypothetical protein [Paucibacter sp. XJ19-41]
MLTCYMCEKPANTTEHAPPKCIFPESKDVAVGLNYRKNLITVPSCDEHNTAKSRDDEYLLHVLAASITSSPTGLTQFLTKVRRSLERNPSLVNSLMPGDTPVMRHVPHKATLEEAFPIVANGERIDRVVSHCARALYFHETSTKFAGRVKVIAPFMSYGLATFDNAVSGALALAKAFLADTAARGENPEVFSYKFARGPQTAVMLLSFYGGTEFLVQFDER